MLFSPIRPITYGVKVNSERKRRDPGMAMVTILRKPVKNVRMFQGGKNVAWDLGRYGGDRIAGYQHER